MRFKKLFALAGVLFFAAACASAPKSACPSWVTQGSGAFGGDSGNVLYGVGTASNIKNFALLKKTADNRAINELAAQMEVTSKSLMKDYMASTSADDKVSEEQHVEQGIKTVVNQTLTGVMIVDRCDDTERGNMHSLARLDFDRFKDLLDKSESLSERVKEHVKKNADKVFDELKEETSK